ncbi:eukaryotic translation initiation factor 2A [Neocloeon triangulifer]|uniref:eukaryotic translation initiation factor 2A n=1 Tax=Neocloeon triangulifer TaxID=2078957 RepID=UPI00286F84FE|nr:eukaryotic translation initiation factor 2A [Neocloeon triangulifer]
MAAEPVPHLAIRGSTGLLFHRGPPSYELNTQCPRDMSKQCKFMAFSPNGQYFAWTNSAVVTIVAVKDWSLVQIIARPRVLYLKFSPKGTYLMVWEAFMTTPDNPQGSPNMNVYRTQDGELLKGYVFKKHSGWELQWSDDEKLCGRNSGSDVFFYEDGDLEKVAGKVGIPKVASFSLSPGPKPIHVVCYIPGKQGQPGNGKLFQYPKFEPGQAVASKSFFQAERLETYWNAKGTTVLLMTNVDVDSSGASYYGKQSLHFVTTKGDSSMVALAKDGPVYSVEWSPNSSEFCVVYGYMPAKATVYNAKAEAIFDFGTGPRNVVYYSPLGDLMLLAGFGNLRGAIEVWDTTSNRKQISSFNAPDSTWLGWCPDGQHFATATTAPRLRQGNGFKVWHYSGAMLFERPWNKEEELWEVQWQTYPPNTFQPKPISKAKIQGIQPSQPQASKEVYRPPSARGKESNFKLHEFEAPQHIRPGRGLPPGITVAPEPNKAPSKQKKKRDAKKANKATTIEESSEEPTPKSAATPASYLPKGITEDNLQTDDPEKAKKIKNLKKKLQDIAKLKDLASSGKQLELNQAEKIKKEGELVAELKALVL